MLTWMFAGHCEELGSVLATPSMSVISVLKKSANFVKKSCEGAM